MEGTIDGAPCSEADLEAGTLQSVSGAYWGAEPIAPREPYVALGFPEVAHDWTQTIYLVRYGGIGYSTLLAALKASRDSGAMYLPLIDGSQFGDLLKKATVRSGQCCGEPVEACGDTGLNRDFVPPLENELTENSDPYENSWRHYLDLAKAAAAEADRLGDDLVAAGLEMDNRTEQSIRRLEDLCGGVITLDPFATGETLCDSMPEECDVVRAQVQQNPSLQSCLPGEYYGGSLDNVEHTVLGENPVCAYRLKDGTGAICQCADGDTCPTACPMVPGDTSHDTCAQEYADFLSEYGEKYETVFVERKLNIFASGSTSKPTANACAQLSSLENLVSQRNSLNPPDRDDYRQALEEITWFNPRDLQAILGYTSLDVDILHHYTLSFGGTQLWHTRQPSLITCPPPRPWREGSDQGITQPCVRTQNEVNTWGGTTLVAGGDPSTWADWLHVELRDPEGLNPQSQGYAWKRKKWGHQIAEYLLILGLLADRTDMIRMAGYYYTPFGYGSGDHRPYGNIPPGIAMRERSADFADESIVCIDPEPLQGSPSNPHEVYEILMQVADDPNIAPCHSVGGPLFTKSAFRFEYALDYSAVSTAGQYLNFWQNIDNFFVTPESEQLTSLWNAQSEYHPDRNFIQVGQPHVGNHIIFESLFSNPWFADTWNGGEPLNWPFDNLTVSVDKLMEALRLGCYLKERADDPSSFYTADAGESMPELTSVDSIPRIRDYLRNVAANMNKRFELLVIANLPTSIVDNFKPGATQTLYPEHKGASLEHLLAMDGALQSIATGAIDVKRIMIAISDIFDVLYLNKEKLETEDDLNNLRTARNVLSDVIGAFKATEGFRKFDLQSGATAVMYAAMAAIDIAIGSLNGVIIQLNEQLLYKESMRQIRTSLRELHTTASNIRKAFSNLQSAASKLESNGIEATSRFAFALGLDSDEAGHVFHSNTVMRRRYNTLRERYDKAFLRAKRLAFIARRAIEFRLGVDLGQMDRDMTLVPKPSSWADRVCTMQGFDYRKLRTADEDDPLFDPEVQDSDSYTNWYLGDYVQTLSDFVESYNMDYPFTDERDIAVLSLKNDIMRARSSCQKESYNLLAHSGDIGRQSPVEKSGVTALAGWVTAGCISETIPDCDPNAQSCTMDDACVDAVVDSPDSAVQCDVDFCFGQDYRWNNNQGHTPAEGTRLSDRVPDVRDREIVNGRLTNWKNSGYVSQTVTVPEGYFVLSWWARQAQSGVPQVTYRVEVQQDGVTLTSSTFEDVPTSTWMPQWRAFRVPGPGPIEVQIHPSMNDSQADDAAPPEHGDLLIWGAQLEHLPPGNGRCAGEDCLLVEPIAYQETDETRLVDSSDCVDTDGASMRSRFTYRCICLDRPNGVCDAADFGSPYQKCFWEYPFTLTLDGIEASASIPSNNISVGNFNYRHESMAVNFVGTNVIDCTRTASPSTCYANAFLNYTFEHRGDVQVRSHERETREFSMPTARVEHGKGLTAEVLVTNPISGSHTTLLADYWKDGLRGRPLQGQYYLRIWDTSGLAWSTLEDIQILWRYRYWTAMGSSY